MRDAALAEAISDLDKEIIRVLQGDFPLVEEPYKELARKVGISEKELLERVRQLSEEKKIRKMGAVLRHREVGFSANVLCAWVVPQDRLDEIASRMSCHPAVSHCYDRNTAPGWPYNLYTMIHACSREECEEIAAELGRENGIETRTMLYSKKEWKKTSMKYFCE
ncbi:MAG: AsnC family transcriptional regulator [Selenomonadaceae bacterium]|nr:AsnC family transcriptional regulator [Selenomonadaceae bacterium]MBR0284027.1 AsnC family transcriptional regulator [Selenomonadaceae bacterium]MBR6343610.1 AsnC family transcriptional regulator [Selenomonadaceae bacterium]MBR6711138.1 AsnC family transcriptional regulator [Selenomonadaceae bacterium]